MKILWVGDAAVSTGFARCTHAACDALHGAGHEVHVLGINHYGDPHSFPYPIYPCHQPVDGGRDGFGVTRLPVLVNRLEPDLVVLLNDPWNVRAYLDSMRDRLPEGMPIPPTVGYLAVDALNQPGHELNDLVHVIVWTEFAAEELRRGGYEGESTVVPLGVDLSRFYPRDRAESQHRVLGDLLPSDAFLVGVVGRNQPRKRLDLTIAYFAQWITQRHIDNAYLYLHIAPTGDRGFDLRSLIQYHGVEDRVVVGKPLSIGHGAPDDLMPFVYSAMDIYLNTTQGEGWGLPALEAMACGIPCIVPDWSGLGDWTRDAAIRVACTSTAISAPMNGLAYTIGGVMDKAAAIDELHSAYSSSMHRTAYGQRGMRMAAALDWAANGIRVRSALELAAMKAQGLAPQEAAV